MNWITWDNCNLDYERIVLVRSKEVDFLNHWNYFDQFKNIQKNTLLNTLTSQCVIGVYNDAMWL